MTVKAEGLDVDQVAAAKPKLTITAESPLRADSADRVDGQPGGVAHQHAHRHTP